MRISGVLPKFLLDELKLNRAKRRFPQADYIRSHSVSVDARLGERVGIGEGVLVNPGVEIGDYSYVNRGALIFSGTIGRFCSIAHYSQIGAEWHPARHLSSSPFIYGDKSLTGQPSGFVETFAPPVIGSDVWVGSSAIIMQGVTVGHGAVIASGAVVTKDVAPFSIVAGVPAKVIGQRFADAVAADLLEMAWWDWPAAKLTELAPLVAAGESFTDLLMPAASPS